MAVPFNRIQSEAIDNYGTKEAFNGLAQFDGIIWWLGQKGMIRFETGGQPDFRERLMYGPNTTIAFRGHTGTITMIDDEGFTLISVPQKTISGAILYNQVEVDRVRGNSALAKGLIEDKTRQFSNTWPRIVASTLRQDTPGAEDPYTLLGASGTANAILLPQAPASQTVTTGGIPRSEVASMVSTTIRFWANQYSNTSMDLTGTAGRRSLNLLVYALCRRGNGMGWAPDFGLCGLVAFASLGAAADANRRGSLVGENALEYC